MIIDKIFTDRDVWWAEDCYVFAEGKRICDTTPNPEDNPSEEDYEEAENNAIRIAMLPHMLKLLERAAASMDVIGASDARKALRADIMACIHDVR